MKIKIEIKEVNKKAKFEEGSDLEAGIYHATYDGDDRIIVVHEYEDMALVIDDIGRVQSIEKDSVAGFYRNPRKISDLKIEFEA